MSLPSLNLLRVDQQSKLQQELDKLDGTKFAYDFETYGVKYMSEGFFVRSVSFHNDHCSLSVEVSDSEGNYYQGASALFNWISRQQGLIAHNAGFEMGCLYAMTGEMVYHHACTYALLASLANEGSPNQSWGLKKAGCELAEIEDWSKDIPKSAEMGKLPFDKLGWYNQMDSAVTWHIYKLCVKATQELDRPDIFWDYFNNDLTNQINLQTEAYIHGLHVNTEYTQQYFEDIDEEIAEALSNFVNHPKVTPHIQKLNEAAIKEVERWVANYSKKYKKDGAPTANFLKAKEKLEQAKQANHFNIESPKQLQALLYNNLKCEVKMFTDGGEPSTGKRALSMIPVYGKLILTYREKLAQKKFLRSVLDNEQDGIIRVSIKVPGTITGRLSAGGLE